MKNLRSWLQQWGVLVAFIVLFLASAITQPGVFLQPENLKNLVNQNVDVGILAIGMTLVIISGGIDLSVGSLMALSAAASVTVLNQNMARGEAQASLIAAVVALGSGALLGAVNGFLVAFGRVAPFVATLVGMVAFRSLCLAMAEGGEIRSSSYQVFPNWGTGGLPLPFVKTASGSPLVVTWGMLSFIVLAVVIGLYLNRTIGGRYTIAVGANERAAKYSAIDTRKVKFGVYTIMGLLAGVAGLAMATRMNSVATSTLGLYKELDAIAAVVIGGTSLRGGFGRIWGTVVGVLLLGIITNMLVVANVSIYWQGFVKGLVILVAVLLQGGEEN